MSSKKSLNISFPFFTLLGLLFIGLKLGGVGSVATWSWWLVLLPLYGPLLVALSLLAIFFIVALTLGK